MIVFVVGTLFIVTALVASAGAVLGYTLLIRGYRPVLPWTRRSIWVASGSSIVATGILLALFVLGRYEFANVYQYSSADLEMRYKLSALWAGQQGSFMIWLLVGMLAAPILIKRSRVYEPYVLAPLMLLQTAILILMLIQNPFQLRLDTTGAIIHSPDGMGLNELLHNPWMVIHPPMLFFGYGLLAIPFAYALGGLWRRDYDGWIRPALPWTIAAWVVLATALTFGGYWAYETLGWGGYWGWDPVENSSLLPWLTTSALLHGMLVQRAHGGLRRANFFLALVSYSLVIYASFLTRSGVLGNFSVHSFTESGLSIALIILLVGTIGIGSVVLLYRWRDIPSHPLAEHFWSRDTLFVLGMMTFVLLAILIGIGTSMPVLSSIPGIRETLHAAFTQAFDIQRSIDGRFSLQPLFYQRITPPFGVVIIALMTIAPLFGWRGGSLRSVLLAVRVPGGAAVLGLVGALMLGVRDLLGLLYVGFGVFAVGVNLLMVFRTLKRGWLWIGGYMAHIGAAILVIGFVGSAAYSTPEERMTIPLGETQRIHQYAVTFNGYTTRINTQGAAKGVLSLGVQRDSDDEPTQVEPQLYVNPRDGQWIRTPGIVRLLQEDFYISPGEYLPEVNPNRSMIQQGQTVRIGPYRMLFQQFESTTQSDQDVTVAARLTLSTEGHPTTTITPAVRLVANQLPAAIPVPLAPTHTLTLTAFDLANGTIELDVAGLNLPIQPARADIFVSRKPTIRLVWIGTLIMTLGGSLAATRRFIEAHTRYPVPVREDVRKNNTVHPDTM